MMYMENLIIILLVLILLETSYLSFRHLRKTNLGKNPKRKVFIDSSILIDGRILAIAQTGFLGDELLIPRSVLRELQLLADGSDADKRSKARYGLEVVNSLERVVEADAAIFSDDIKGRFKVDERLIDLAKEYDGAILTNDFNLAQVASAEGISALNLNDLVLSLRSDYVPGEKVRIKLTTAGSNKNQAIGYLKDGTMVVVDEAKKQIGKTIEVELIRQLQTNSGKMLFAQKTTTKRGRR